MGKSVPHLLPMLVLCPVPTPVPSTMRLVTHLTPDKLYSAICLHKAYMSIHVYMPDKAKPFTPSHLHELTAALFTPFHYQIQTVNQRGAAHGLAVRSCQGLQLTIT
mmetsp:Transcript_18288/g.39359  ORF Transcript_18288/g.39359 Transcript_18288/m.39359 type:complete len:106 (-) Transcript_18288:1509-1826(-)